MNRDHPNAGTLSTWVLAALLLAGGVAGAGDIESGIFEDGARRRGEEYRRARGVLVQRGPKLIAFLRQKADSEDWHERMFAQILIARIQRPQDVARWDKTLGDLVEDHHVREAANKYPEPEWGKLPTKTADVPPAHLVDVLWETAGHQGNSRQGFRRTAAAIQFYLVPEPDAVEAVVEVLAADYHLRHLAREAFFKLGAAAVPRMRQVLEQTEPPQPKDPDRLTPEEREQRRAYWQQMSRAAIAAQVLARQGDAESVPLILKCLRQAEQSHEYIEALCGALAEMKAVAAVDPILDQVLRSATARQRIGGSGKPGYDVLRSHIVTFGKDAVPAVKQRLQAAEMASDRIVLQYLVVELSGAEGRELDVAALRESLWFDETAAGLRKLHEMTGEDVFPRLAALARGDGPSRSGADGRKRAMLTLGEMREKRAVPLLADVPKDRHALLQRILEARTTGENAKGFDPQVARESADGFGREDTRLAEVLDWGDTALLALRRIGSVDARQAVAAATAYDEYRTRAELSLLLIDGRIDQIAARLDDKNRAVREEAALALLEIGDPRATRQLLCAAARRQGSAHQQWRQSALSSAHDISAELRELLRSEDVRQRVLGEAMLLEAESPDKAARCRQSIEAAAQSIGRMHVIRFDMIEAAGRGLAAKTTTEQEADASDPHQRAATRPFDPWNRFAQLVQPLDESHLPLVEATCLFDRGVIRRGIAAFALAQWKKPRSMAVLAASFNMGSLGGSNPAALALADFGRAGAELAANVPPPKPGQIDTGLRMTRHRGGTRVLAEQKDIRGVDEILKGLKTLEEDPKLSMWSYRANIYLTAANKFHDQRLVEPLLRILSVAESPQRDVHATVIKLLAPYDDPRLVPLFTQHLTTHLNREQGGERGYCHQVALTALTRRLGEKTPQHLLEQLEASDNDGFRGGVLLGLGELSHPSHPPYPGKAGWSPAALETPDERNRAAAKTRELAYPVLVEALDDPSPLINTVAAEGLLILARGSGAIQPDLRAVEPLTRWCERHNQCTYPLTDYLANYGDAETGRVLLDVLKSQTSERGDPHLVGAVGKLKPPGAVRVLDRNVRAKFAGREGPYGLPRELEVLAEFGSPGKEALVAIFREVDHMSCRLHTARILARKHWQEAAEPIAELLRQTIEAGPASEKLVSSSSTESREKAYVRTCASLIESLQRLDPAQAKQIAEAVIRNGPGSLRAACLKTWAGE